MNEPTESIEWLARAIEQLPSDQPVPAGTRGYNRYTTQKAHWLGWLRPESGTGSYPRSTSKHRDAHDVYNRIVEPKLLMWLISAAGIPNDIVQASARDASIAKSLAGQAAAIRRHVPWHVLAACLRSHMDRADSGSVEGQRPGPTD